MTYLVDINKGKKESKFRFFIHLFLVILIFSGLIATSIILLIISSLNYVPLLITDILLTCIAICGLVFYGVNIYPIDHHYYNFFNGLNNYALSEERILTYECEKENKVKNHVVYRYLSFSFKDMFDKKYENLYVLDNPIEFKKGDIIKVKTFRNVIICYEVIENAKI